jgi:serine/threonine protein kinase
MSSSGHGGNPVSTPRGGRALPKTPSVPSPPLPLRVPTKPPPLYPGAVAAAISPTVPAPPNAVDDAEAQASSMGQRAAGGGPKRCPTCGTHYPSDFLVCPKDATSLHMAAGSLGDVDPLVGIILGETYKVHRLIGEGGMARVYEARHLRLGDRRLAVKILHPEYARDPDVVQRFQREAESSSAINHPNVIDVFDVASTPDGRPYMVGEFLDGEELGEHLKKVGRLDMPTAVAITRQICRALNAAHLRGIVHRDMKPENVFMIARDGLPHVKVLDFGISKAGNRQTHLTRTGMIMGTPSFMAPEQARGDKVDSRADVYAVGAVLYALVTGRRPFDSDDPAAILTQVLTEEPVRPRELLPEILPGLELVIQKSMTKDPRDRFQTMAELDAQLAPFDVAAPFSPEMQTLLRRSEVSISELSPLAMKKSADATSRTLSALAVNPNASAQLAAVSIEALESEAKAARRARPMIVTMSLGLLIWFVGGIADALGGTIRYFRPGDITPTESVLLVVGTLLLAVTPSVLFVLHLRRTVWPNSVRAVQLSSDLLRTASAAFMFYGLGSLIIRALYTVFLRRTSELSLGIWDAVFFVLSLVGATIAGGIGPVARLIRRKANG